MTSGWRLRGLRQLRRTRRGHLESDAVIEVSNGLVYASGFEVGVGGRELQARDFREDRVPLDCVDPETRRKALFTDSLPRGAEEGGPEIIPGDEKVHRIRQRNFMRLHESGIAVAVGAGGGAPLTLHGPATAYEMRAMQRAGLTPMEVLVAATRNGGHGDGSPR